MDPLLRSALPLSVNLNRYATKVATHMKLLGGEETEAKKWKFSINITHSHLLFTTGELFFEVRHGLAVERRGRGGH